MVPLRFQTSLTRYVSERIETGGFLRAVLENDLHEAVSRADYESLDQLPTIVMYVSSNLPTECWGSKEKVERWLHPLVNCPGCHSALYDDATKAELCSDCEDSNATRQVRHV